MKIITLTKGKSTIIDDQDFEWLSEYKWRLNTTGYAGRTQYLGGGRKNIKQRYLAMHRAILERYGIDIQDKQIDHKNQNKLDNRKENLRVATPSQNCINRFVKEKNTSGYKGVTRHLSPRQINPTWIAQTKVKGKYVYFGTYKTREEAASAYNKGMQEHFGDFAIYNQL